MIRPRNASLARTLARSLALVWRASPKLTVANTLLAVTAGLLPYITLTYAKLVVDALVDAVRSSSATDRSEVMLLVAIWFGTQALASTLVVVANAVRTVQHEAISHHVNVLLIEKAGTLHLSHFEDHAIYDKLENSRNEASYRPGRMMSDIFAILQAFVSIGSVIGVLVTVSWWLIGAIGIVAIPNVIVQSRLGVRYFGLQTGRVPELRKMIYLRWLLTNDGSFKELRLLDLFRPLTERYRSISERFLLANRKLTAQHTAASVGVNVTTQIVTAASYFYVAAAVLAGRMTVGTLTQYYQALQQSNEATDAIARGVAGILEHALFLEQLFSFLEIESSCEKDEARLVVPNPIERGIALHNVSFKYQGRETPAVNDVSFEIRPGEVIAIVGHNGSGKTSLVKLITRLYEPSTGRIEVDGIDVGKVNIKDWQRRIGVLFQDFQRYQFLARENIGFGYYWEADDLERIMRAAREANVAAMAESLPLGLDTQLGRWFEGGVELSGGEWQKIALARTFMRNADLIILDEPTASLDAQSEQEIFQTVAALGEGKMVVLISHRFNTVRLADRIVVLNAGEVVEIGTHAELTLKGGKYAEMYAVQSAAYR